MPGFTLKLSSAHRSSIKTTGELSASCQETNDLPGHHAPAATVYSTHKALGRVGATLWTVMWQRLLPLVPTSLQV